MPHQEFDRKSRKIRSYRTSRGLSEASNTISDTDGGKRQLIISKAITLFAKFGYDNVRISDITNSIDIAKGTLYLYFKTKDDLLLECFGELNRLLQILENRDEIRNEKDLSQKNRNRWIGFAARYSEFGGLLNLLRTSCGSNDEVIRKKARDTYDLFIEPLRRDIKNAIEEGSVCDIDPELASYYLVGAAESLAFRLNIDNRYTITGIGKAVYRLNEKALAPDKSEERADKSEDDRIGMISDIGGTSTEVRRIRFAGDTFLAGKIGEGDISVDTSRISLLNVRQVNSKCHGYISATDGTYKEIELDGEAIISGESSFGTLRIPAKNVSSITFHPKTDG